RENQARPEVAAAQEGPHGHWILSPRGLPPLALVAPEGNELRDGAARRTELHRDHARVAHDLAAAFLDFLGGPAQVLDLDREMMDARALARRLRFRGLRALVVLDQREVDLPVGHVARDV